MSADGVDAVKEQSPSLFFLRITKDESEFSALKRADEEVGKEFSNANLVGILALGRNRDSDPNERTAVYALLGRLNVSDSLVVRLYGLRSKDLSEDGGLTSISEYLGHVEIGTLKPKPTEPSDKPNEFPRILANKSDMLEVSVRFLGISRTELEIFCQPLRIKILPTEKNNLAAEILISSQESVKDVVGRRVFREEADDLGAVTYVDIEPPKKERESGPVKASRKL